MGLSQLASEGFSRYSKYLAAVGSLTELFSDSDRPLINSRAAERLFVYLSGARDLSRKDNSFDACLGKAGVGIKTFTASSLESASLQKIAEFSNASDRNQLGGLNPKRLAMEVSMRRNLRLSSHAVQSGIDINQSYYHCIVRIPGGIVILETELRLIDTKNIKPLDSKGRALRDWPKSVKQNSSIVFTDGFHTYSYHPGKNVLMMRFDLKAGFVSSLVTVRPIPDIFNHLLKQAPSLRSLKSDSSGIRVVSLREAIDPVQQTRSLVLPLYSSKSGQIPQKSGLNQWLATGRKRSFGEAYISIPSIVRDVAPEFFPPKDESFLLDLPNNQKLSVKICQQGGKALMSNPNSDLGTWLMTAVDGSLEVAKKRFSEGVAYRRDDLDRLGSDCLTIIRTPDPYVYEANFGKIGDFESFIELSELQRAT